MLLLLTGHDDVSAANLLHDINFLLVRDPNALRVILQRAISHMLGRRKEEKFCHLIKSVRKCNGILGNICTCVDSIC